MSIIAWDGRSMCADKRAVNYGLTVACTKIWRLDAGLVGIDGVLCGGLELVEWIKAGADPKTLPDRQKDQERRGQAFLVTPDRRILRYEDGPYPFAVEEKFFAAGSGRDYALTAMYLGKTAREAVEIACHFDNGCGNGIDELTF